MFIPPVQAVVGERRSAAAPTPEVSQRPAFAPVMDHYVAVCTNDREVVQRHPHSPGTNCGERLEVMHLRVVPSDLTVCLQKIETAAGDFTLQVPIPTTKGVPDLRRSESCLPSTVLDEVAPLFTLKTSKFGVEVISPGLVRGSTARFPQDGTIDG